MKAEDAAVAAGWIRVPIAEILAPQDDGRLLHHGWSPQCEPDPARSDAEWAALKTTAIQPGAFEPQHNKRMPKHLKPREHLAVKPGDILITCAGPRSRCGVSCLVRATPPRRMISGKMYRFRVPEELIDPRFLEAFLQTTEAWDAIDRMKTGGNESGLNLTHERFLELVVPVAPRREQEAVVAEIENQLTRLDAAVASLPRAAASLARYRSALFHALYEGRLVSFNPCFWALNPQAPCAETSRL